MLQHHDATLPDNLTMENWPDEVLWQYVSSVIDERNEENERRDIAIWYIDDSTRWVAKVDKTYFDEFMEVEEVAHGATIHDAFVALARAVKR